MHSESQVWTFAAIVTSVFNFIAGLTLNDWIAVLGVVGMVISLVMQMRNSERHRQMDEIDRRLKLAQIRKLEKEHE